MRIDFTKKNNAFYINMFVLLAVLISLDRWTKQMANLYLKDNDDYILIPDILQLRYVQNQGAAFGILQGRQYLFFVLTAIICIGIIYLFFKTPIQKKYLPLHIVYVVLFSGAIGNLYDRIFQGYVTDFIYFSLIDFPVFNVADICITCSMAVLIILFIFIYKDEDIDLILKNGNNNG